MHAVVTCGQPTVKKNATVIPAIPSVTYNSSVIYQCISGFWYSPSIYNMTSLCEIDGSWTKVADCVGWII